jgi:hypothetical protein
MFEIIIVFAFIAVIFFLITSQNKVLLKLYRQQATKRNGKVKRFLLVFSKLILFDQGRQIQVYQTSGSKNSPPTTHMNCTLNSMKDYNISISSENVLVKIGKSFGMKDIQIGNSEFDELFLVRGSNEMIVRTFLVPEIQESILHLEERSPTIKIEKKAFNFNISGWLKKEQQFDQFIEAGLKMIKKANEIV